MSNEGHVVTGYQGAPHVKASDAGFLNAGMVGVGRYVLNTGSKFSATANTRNTITVNTGDIVNQGRHINMPESHSLTVENAPVEYTKICRIVMRYNKQPSTGIESAHLMLLDGTPSRTVPAAPSIITGNIFNGEMTDDVLLYEFTVNETGITSGLTTKFTIINPISTLNTHSKSNQDRLDVLETVTTADGTKGTATGVSTASGSCELIKFGNMVMCTMAIGSWDGTGTLPTNTTLFTIPEGYRPQADILMYAFAGRNDSGAIRTIPCSTWIKANGSIEQAAANNVTSVSLTAMWTTAS